MKQFRLKNFEKFKLSTMMDGNYVGEYENSIVRIVEKDINDFKEIVHKKRIFPQLVESEILFEDSNILVIKHHKIDSITYPIEWSRRQKIEAACTTIDLQEKLNMEGYHLKDPHAFNITFDKAKPVFFDFGSIMKGKINPIIWFQFKFVVSGVGDYWGEILSINRLTKWWISIRMIISNQPFVVLRRSITNHIEQKNIIINKFVEYVVRHKQIISFVQKNNQIKNLFHQIKKIFSERSNILITNWTYYDQKDPSASQFPERTTNFLILLRKYKPKKLLDIGANKGAYSKLSLQYGVKKAICIDIDEYSLEILRSDIKQNNLPIWTVKMDIMNYIEKPGRFNSYLPAYLRFKTKFCICFAVIHHICYFGDYTFEQFAKAVDKFSEKILIVEFIPYDDSHLSGPVYNGEDRSWYTQKTFINVMRKYFKKEIEIFESNPKPRKLIKFEK